MKVSEEYFALEDDTTDVSGKCRNLVREIQKDFGQGWVVGVHVVRADVSNNFLEKITSHPSVKEFWATWKDACRLRGIPYDHLNYGGIKFKASDVNYSGVNLCVVNVGANHPPQHIG